jgi:membrane protease YdiL (CAAX protease family)
MIQLEAQDQTEWARQRRELGGSVYAVLFLAVITYGFDRAFAFYMDRLVHAKEISRWTVLVRDFDRTIAGVFLFALIIVISCYRLGPLRMRLRDMGLAVSFFRLKEVLWGLLAGCLLYAASLPILLRLDLQNGLAGLIVSDFYHPGMFVLALLFALLLPVFSETVYRGIIFKAFLKSSSVGPAIVASAFSFAFTWPVFDPLIGLLLGVGSAFLYRRFGNVVPAIVANAMLTVACAATVAYKRVS